jgi:hypothetical protein
MAKTLEETRIENEMYQLEQKWKGKEEPQKYSSKWFERNRDREKYKELRAKIKEIHEEPDIVKEAKKIFGLDEGKYPLTTGKIN